MGSLDFKVFSTFILKFVASLTSWSIFSLTLSTFWTASVNFDGAALLANDNYKKDTKHN